MQSLPDQFGFVTDERHVRHLTRLKDSPVHNRKIPADIAIVAIEDIQMRFARNAGPAIDIFRVFGAVSSRQKAFFVFVVAQRCKSGDTGAGF